MRTILILPDNKRIEMVGDSMPKIPQKGEGIITFGFSGKVCQVVHDYEAKEVRIILENH